MTLTISYEGCWSLKWYFRNWPLQYLNNKPLYTQNFRSWHLQYCTTLINKWWSHYKIWYWASAALKNSVALPEQRVTITIKYLLLGSCNYQNLALSKLRNSIIWPLLPVKVSPTQYYTNDGYHRGSVVGSCKGRFRRNSILDLFFIWPFSIQYWVSVL